MLVATFGPSTEWQGREIIWDVDHFILVGHGAIPAAGVLDYDRRGHLIWADPGYRAWAASVDHWEHGGESAVTGTAVSLPAGGAQPGSPAARGRRFPSWVIVVGVVAAVAVVVALILVAVVPSMLVRTVQGMSRNADVSNRVETIQMGIEAYAREHNGRFPDPGEVNPIGLARYITVWPENPFTHMPMADGGGEGNFRYDLSSDGGAYRLIGYGSGGKTVIELSGGTPTAV